MNKELLAFIDRFDVLENLRIYILTVVSREEAVILNHLVDKEQKTSDIISEYPQLDSSLIESLYNKGYLVKEVKGGEAYFRSNTFDQIMKRFVTDSPTYRELNPEEKRPFREFITNMYLERMKRANRRNNRGQDAVNTLSSGSPLPSRSISSCPD